eukprot:m.128031 g.128031  ORF g.128031 m.128031 type:complete len:366 (+) comp16382_c0_seq3:429-1526(+)
MYGLAATAEVLTSAAYASLRGPRRDEAGSFWAAGAAAGVAAGAAIAAALGWAACVWVCGWGRVCLCALSSRCCTTSSCSSGTTSSSSSSGLSGTNLLELPSRLRTEPLLAEVRARTLRRSSSAPRAAVSNRRDEASALRAVLAAGSRSACMVPTALSTGLRLRLRWRELLPLPRAAGSGEWPRPPRRPDPDDGAVLAAADCSACMARRLLGASRWPRRRELLEGERERERERERREPEPEPDDPTTTIADPSLRCDEDDEDDVCAAAADLSLESSAARSWRELCREGGAEPSFTRFVSTSSQSTKWSARPLRKSCMSLTRFSRSLVRATASTYSGRPSTSAFSDCSFSVMRLRSSDMAGECDEPQ